MYDLIAIAVFSVTLFLVITERIHRSVAVMSGAVALLAFGILDLEKAIHYVDFETLLLLLGMMAMVEVLKELGLFHYLAIKIAKFSGGYRTFFYFITLAAGLLSPFLHAVTVMLIFSTITVAICKIVNKDPRPLLMAQLFAANIGGNATLIGEPTNMIVGLHAKFSFLDFIYVMAPLTIISLIITIYILAKYYKVSDEEISAYLEELDEYSFVKDMHKLKLGVLIFVLTIILFFFQGFLHVSPAVVALVGATAMLLVIEPDLGELLSKVEWDIILFIGSFFVLVGGLVETGVIDKIANLFLSMPSHELWILAIVIAYLSALASGFIDNIPYVAMMVPVIDELNRIYGGSLLWWILLLGSNFGGNLTPIASSPNIVIIAVSDKEGLNISFTDFMRIGVPIVMITISVGIVVLLGANTLGMLI